MGQRQRQRVVWFVAFLVTCSLGASAEAQSSSGCTPVPPGLLAWWPGDGDRNDVQGTNHGTLQNGATFGPGIVGQAFRLNVPGPVPSTCPSCDFVSISNNFPASVNGVTVEVWVRPTQDPPSSESIQWIYTQYSGSGAPPTGHGDGPQLGFVGNGGAAFFWRPNLDSNAGTFSVPGALPPNTWTHIAGTYDSTLAESHIYVNGTLVASEAVSGVVPLIDAAFIGKRLQQEFFVGLLDELSIYDRALGASEIQAIVAAGNAGKCRPNAVPVANAGPDLIVEANAPLTSVMLDGLSSSDPDGDLLTYRWTDEANNVVGTTAVATVLLPVGTRTFTLTVDDNHGGTASDTVTVIVHDTTAPTITVTRPNGGEKLFAGSAYTIEWTAADSVGISAFNVFISTNGGSTFNPVPGCANVNGALRSCVWSVPGPATSGGRIFVVATDDSGNTSTDGSNANFAIAAGIGSITLTTPNTQVDWGIGSIQQIKWSHNIGAQAYVHIELSRDAGETWETLASSFKNTAAASGVFNWMVTGPTVEDVARIRVSGVNVAASDVGDANFSISMPYVAATTPATTSTNLGYGSARKQTWTTNLGPLETVDVLLSTDGGASFPLVLASNVTASTKTATFTTPALGVPTAAARIGVRWTNGGTVIGVNPVNIKVQPSYVKVTSPNLASEGWTVGSTPTLTWASNLGASEQVKIDLSLDGGATYPIVVSVGTPSDGDEPVSVQPGWVTPNARVRVTWVRDASVSDVSYQSFVIR